MAGDGRCDLSPRIQKLSLETQRRVLQEGSRGGDRECQGLLGLHPGDTVTNTAAGRFCGQEIQFIGGDMRLEGRGGASVHGAISSIVTGTVAVVKDSCAVCI